MREGSRSHHSTLKGLRAEVFPTPFCAGCGHGILMGAILRAVDKIGWHLDEMLFVSGIGCAGWIPSPHFAADTLHTTHGRPIAFATGAKLFRPELRVVVIGGDGDIASIGGNHLIHAARRNIDLTVICANNRVYGMTGGQVTPTTPQGAFTATTPQGNPEPPFDLCRLVSGAGATYVARHTVYHVKALINILARALEHEGFAFVEVLSPCPTQYGRRNELLTPWAMMRWLKENTITVKKAVSTEEIGDKIVVGEFNDAQSRAMLWQR